MLSPPSLSVKSEAIRAGLRTSSETQVRCKETLGLHGTGSYGAGLARHLTEAGVEVVEVNRRSRLGSDERGDEHGVAGAVVTAS